jgi:hypothetical protein
LKYIFISAQGSTEFLDRVFILKYYVHGKGKGKDKCEGKVKFTLEQATKAQRGSRGRRKLGCVVNNTTRPLYPRERDPVPILQESGWALGPIWTGAENLAPHWDSIPRPSSPYPVTIPTELSRTTIYVYMYVLKYNTLIQFHATLSMFSQQIL